MGHEKLKPELFLLFPAIIHAGTGMFLTLVQNIGFVCLSNSVSSSTPHTPIPCPRTASVKPEVPSITFRFGTSLWHVQQVSQKVVFKQHYRSLVSHCHWENVASQERQRRARSWVHVKSRVHRVECLPGEKRLVQSNSSVLGLSGHHHRPEDWAE